VSSTTYCIQFGLLEPPRPRTAAFGSGFLITTTIVVVGALVPTLVRTQKVISAQPYLVSQLIAPVVSHAPAPVVKADVPAVQPIEIRPETPRVTMRRPPQLPPSPVKQLNLPEIASPRLQPQVHTNVFASTGSPAKPTSKSEPRLVQTGGFGDPAGVTAREHASDHSQLPKVGAFDLPPGGGEGNGSGGTHGERATVASVGFGNGVATENAGSRNIGQVRQAGFSDAAAAAPAVAAKKEAPVNHLEPVEILSKPNPSYSDAARKRRLEGDVVVEVVFLSSGEVRVLRIVQGLDQELDQAAIAAARQIRFKPAKRDGQSYDLMAKVHIAFRLAY
jgi:TonB family protein